MSVLLRGKLFLIVLSLINFVAGVFSFTYYSNQLGLTSPFLWFFVVDCPIAALIFGISIILLVIGKPSPIISFIAIVGNIKFGLWTIFVFLMSGTIQAYFLFAVSHFFLILETIVLAGLFSFRVKHVLFGTIFFLINDYFDYVFNLHPFIQSDLVFEAGFFALFSSLLLPLIISIIFSKRVNHIQSKINGFVVTPSKRKWGSH